ncbi:MAG: hypothetical protein ACI80K_000491, partial [Paracoccaceae bacterium]
LELDAARLNEHGGLHGGSHRRTTSRELKARYGA